jgi:hypothetical protein
MRRKKGLGGRKKEEMAGCGDVGFVRKKRRKEGLGIIW